MARTAKKKIPIYEEGVLLTEDADSLDFQGDVSDVTISGNDVVQKVRIFVQATEPSNPQVNDIWINTA